MTNKPETTLRDGLLKATIWKQQGERAFYRVSLSRRYRDKDGNWKDSDSFSGTELLQISYLASKAYERTNELRAADRQSDDTPNDGRRS